MFSGLEMENLTRTKKALLYRGLVQPLHQETFNCLKCRLFPQLTKDRGFSITQEKNQQIRAMLGKEIARTFFKVPLTSESFEVLVRFYCLFWLQPWTEFWFQPSELKLYIQLGISTVFPDYGFPDLKFPLFGWLSILNNHFKIFVTETQTILKSNKYF